MKKSYETPAVEVVKFQYRNQVVATSSRYETPCVVIRGNIPDGCQTDEIRWESSQQD